MLFDVDETGTVVTRISTGNVLKLVKLKNGYWKAHTTVNKKMVNVLVHRLVAIKFIPNPFGLPQVNHKDGNKDNNHKDNLEWVTQQENMTHAKENGLLNNLVGEHHGCSKLTEEKITLIKTLYVPRSRCFGTRGLGRRFGVDQSTISVIVNNKSWKHHKGN